MVRIEALVHPFDEFYMIADVLDGSSARLNRENTVSLISNAIQLNIVSEIGPALETQLSNIKNELLQFFVHPTTGNAYMKAYSSIGLRGIYYPVREIKEICAMKYSLEVAKSFLIKCESNSEQNIVDILQNGGIYLLITSLFQILNIDENIGNPTCSRENENITADILEEWKDSNTTYILNDYGSMVQDILDETRIQTINLLNVNIADILDNPTNGMDTVLQFHDSLSTHIDTQLDLLGKRIKDLQDVSNNREIESNAIMQKMKKLSAGTFVPFKGHRINTNKEEFIFVARSHFDILIEKIKLEKISSYLIHIKEFLNQDHLRYLNLKNKLLSVTDSLRIKITLSVKDFENGRLDNKSNLFKIVGNTKEELDFYHIQYQTPIIEKRGLIYRQDFINHWFDLESDQISDVLYNCSVEEYEHVRFDMRRAIQNLESTIQELYRETHISMKFTGQKWGFNHHKLPTICLLGAPDKLVADINRSVQTLPTQNVQVIPMKEENKIFFALYKHGIPLIAMDPIVRIKPEYDQLKDGPIPLNIFDIKNLPTLGE